MATADLNSLNQSGSASNAPPDIGGDSYEAENQQDRDQLREGHKRNIALGLLAAGLATMGAQPRDWRRHLTLGEALGEGGLAGIQTYGAAETGLAQEQQKRLQQRQLAEYRRTEQQDKMLQFGMLAQWRQDQEKQHIADKAQQDRQFAFSKNQSDQEFKARQQQTWVQFQEHLAEMAQGQQTNAQLRELMMQGQNLQRQFQNQITQDKVKTDKQNHMNQAIQSLAGQWSAIQAAGAGTTGKPAQNANQLKSWINHYNAYAKSLRSQAENEDLTFDPGVFAQKTAADVLNHPSLGRLSGKHVEFSDVPETPTAPSGTETAPPAKLGPATAPAGGGAPSFKAGDRRWNADPKKGKVGWYERDEEGAWHPATP